MDILQMWVKVYNVYNVYMIRKSQNSIAKMYLTLLRSGRHGASFLVTLKHDFSREIWWHQRRLEISKENAIEFVNYSLKITCTVTNPLYWNDTLLVSSNNFHPSRLARYVIIASFHRYFIQWILIGNLIRDHDFV